MQKNLVWLKVIFFIEINDELSKVIRVACGPVAEKAAAAAGGESYQEFYYKMLLC